MCFLGIWILEIQVTFIGNTDQMLINKESELCIIKIKLINQQKYGKLDFYYSQFKTWTDEFNE